MKKLCFAITTVVSSSFLAELQKTDSLPPHVYRLGYSDYRNRRFKSKKADIGRQHYIIGIF